jgi:ribonuclease-3
MDELRRRLKDFLKGELGIKPKKMELYEQAFRHRSYVHEQNRPVTESNERMEFLGDSVLGLALVDYLCTTHKDLEEGDMSKMKAQLGSRQTLAEVGRRLGLGDYLVMGRGEEIAGSQHLPSLVSNAYEALVGALYLDRGYHEAAEFVIRSLEPEFGKDLLTADYKSGLQEFAQRRFRTSPNYQVVRAYGPEHHKTFEILARLNGKVYGRGRGHSKKDAEQDAARHALKRFGVNQPSHEEPRRPAMVPGAPPKRRWFWPFGGRS